RIDVGEVDPRITLRLGEESADSAHLRASPLAEPLWRLSLAIETVALWRLVRGRKLLQTQPDHLDHGFGSSGANRLCDPLLCNRENVVDIVLSDRATSAQNIYE